MIRRPLAALLFLVLATSASAQAPLRAAPPVGETATLVRLPGYLGAGLVPDAAAFLPPPPAPGSLAAAADLGAYRSTRALKGQARWTQAAHDAELAPEVLLADFACALGVRLDARRAPVLARLIQRMGRDAGLAAARAKDVYKRPRPFVTHGGPTCVPGDAGLAASWSYPSGHATYGWATGLVLAELAPDRAAPVLARARAYGESRVVCGVHYVSDIEQGRSVASAVIAVLHADPGFTADLAAARAEVARARSGGVPADAGQCKVESDTLARTPW